LLRTFIEPLLDPDGFPMTSDELVEILGLSELKKTRAKLTW
jgi:hypothetical protein